MTTIDSQSPPAYMHLYVDRDARRAANLERDRMPAHFFARGIPDRGEGCQYAQRRGGVRCERGPDHPKHLAPATGPWP